MYTMFDSTTTGAIPESANAVAGYVGGNWPTAPVLHNQFGHRAHVLTIAVNRDENAECLDIENGDAEPADAPVWVRRQHSRGVTRPCVYASQSRVGEVIDLLVKDGIKREEFRVWSAHYTYIPHICGKAEGLDWEADATQWDDKALGRNLDESLCSSQFFASSPKAKPAPKVNALDVLDVSERRLVNSYEKYIKHPRLHKHGLEVTRSEMVVARKLVWEAANEEIKHGKTPEEAWSFRHRGARYKILLDRTKGLS